MDFLNFPRPELPALRDGLLVPETFRVLVMAFFGGVISEALLGFLKVLVALCIALTSLRAFSKKGLMRHLLRFN